MNRSPHSKPQPGKKARLLMLSLLLVAFGASAQEGPARSRLMAFTDGLETLHARFQQRILDAEGREQDASEGEVWVARPQLFRWEYGGDFPEVIVADGKHIWIYDEALDQVTVKDQSSELADSPLSLLTDPGRLDEQFVVGEAGEFDDLYLLELRARSPDSQFERVLLGLDDTGLALMVMEDAFGLRTEIRFSGIERNTMLEPELFRFAPPGSADVIGDVPASR